MQGHENTLQRLAQVIREQWLIFTLAVAVTIGGAAFWYQQSPESYEAEAIIEVTPVSGDDSAFTGISVIRESSDPTRDVETLARFVTTDPVATRADERLAAQGIEPAPEVLAQPVATSFLLSIVAEGSDPESVAATANAYAEATLALRAENFQEQVDAALGRLDDAAAAAAGDEELASALAERRSQLRALQGGRDPSSQLLTPAVVPTEATGPSMALVLAAAAIVGLAWGTAAALLANALLSRVRSERQLLERFNIPILAHVPRIRSSAAGDHPIAPSELTAGSFEAYRTLRHNIEALRRGEPGARSVLITSAGPSEGKTTTALGLASALAESGERVLLVDADLRNPSVGSAIGVAALTGTGSVLAGRIPVDEAVVSARGEYLRGVDVLVVSPTEGLGAEVLTVGSVEAFLASTRNGWDYVVIDSAPLVSVTDALPLAVAADDVLITVRRRHTRLKQLSRLAELVNRYSAQVRGFVFVESARKPSRDDQRYYGSPRPTPRKSIEGDIEADPRDPRRAPTATQSFMDGASGETR